MKKHPKKNCHCKTIAGMKAHTMTCVFGKKKGKIVERFSDIDKGGLRTEWVCDHGIGHHRGVHGCDGCCAKESQMKLTSTENSYKHKVKLPKNFGKMKGEKKVPQVRVEGWAVVVDGKLSHTSKKGWRNKKKQLSSNRVSSV